MKVRFLSSTEFPKPVQACLELLNYFIMKGIVMLAGQ